MNALSLSFRAKEAAKAIGVSLAAFHELQNPKSPRFDPRFPAKIRLGPRSIVYAREDLLRYLESRKVDPQRTGKSDQ